MADFTFRIKRRDEAIITVQAESESEAEDQVWELIQYEYETIDDLIWEGDHDVKRAPDAPPRESILEKMARLERESPSGLNV